MNNIYHTTENIAFSIKLVAYSNNGKKCKFFVYTLYFNAHLPP